MERDRSVDKLARYILYGFAFALIFVIGWYFKSVLVYIVVAAVVSLVAKPVMHGLSKVEIKGKVLPVWLSAVITLVLLLTLFLVVFVQVIPIVAGIV